MQTSCYLLQCLVHPSAIEGEKYCSMRSDPLFPTNAQAVPWLEARFETEGSPVEKRGSAVVDDLSCAVEDNTSDWVSPCFSLHLWPSQRRCKAYREKGTGRIIRWVWFTQGQNVELPVRGGVRRQGMASIDKSSTRQAWRCDWVRVEGQTQLVVG